MKISQSLPRPQSWIDFESLCKKLWGEIWNCPEIKKNGRQGQAQNGVDVCGMPKGETGYYGIQCKGKDEYTDKNFTTKEIDLEIEKAKNFRPKLKKLYFATTAKKDTKIESYVMEANLKNIKDGLFEVHLFCWEDIVDLIFENQDTYNYYMNSQNFKENFSVEVNFDNNSNTIKFYPKFRKDTIIKVAKKTESYNPRERNTLDLLGATFGFNTTKFNASLNRIQLKLKNTGKRDITNFKIFLTLEGNIEDITEDNLKFNIPRINPLSSFNIDKEEKQIEIIPVKKILVGDEEYCFEEFFIKTPPYNSLITLNWKLISSNFKADGKLLIDIEPEIIEQELPNETTNPYEVGQKTQKQVEDYWEYKNKY
ncbi:hypothetical protein [Elizabethkingia anophelis]|uniref:hypothetical protein n=1 Tax=Elizabethkingia anophelis TaxID=1117645 RepID=UPI001317A2B5|nr:hypothetical protein [Elizabethkingia anophelis]MBE9391923.1 hypothetical protein [Elizabethkingia anophelis]MBE9405363.1 hypothetical protein [Elizabethkingia anophelis]BBQ06389.1 hypothetical protein JUNP353_0960 [Elizabethkingia anophelis]